MVYQVSMNYVYPTFLASPYLKCSGGESACFLLATCGGDNLVKLWHLYTASGVSFTLFSLIIFKIKN